jgi:hypothetical protein
MRGSGLKKSQKEASPFFNFMLRYFYDVLALKISKLMVAQ